MKKAIVGMDLSPAEQPMMDCLPDLLRWGIEEVILVHVIQVGYAQWEGFGQEEKYKQWLDRKAERLNNVGLRTSIKVIDSGVVAQELIDTAHEAKADLIVVGSRSHDLTHTLFLGSVAKDVLRKTPIPVLLERIEPSVEETELVCASVCWEKHVSLVLASDFSESSRAAEAAALRLLAYAETAHFISVVEAAENVEEDVQQLENIQAELSRLKEQASEFDTHVETMVVSGEASEKIAQAGEDLRAMLIVVGKHGCGWVPEKLIGHVAESVCRISKRPVLMVP